MAPPFTKSVHANEALIFDWGFPVVDSDRPFCQVWWEEWVLRFLTMTTQASHVRNFETWTDLGARMAIDASTLFREVIRVRKALLAGKDDRMSDRLKSLTQVLDEMERINKVLKLGCVSEKMVAQLNVWSLADDDHLVLSVEALQAYAALAGCRVKPSPQTSFNQHENHEMTALLRTATESGVLQPNYTDQVVFSRGGRMGIMHVLGPLSFLRFKRWLAMQPERTARQAQQDQQQIDIVEQLIAADLLSSAYDQY